MLDRFKTLCKQRVERWRTKASIHFYKTLYQGSDPAKYLAICAKKLSALSELDIRVANARNMMVFSSMNAEDLTEVLQEVIHYLDHDLSIRQRVELGFFKNMNAMEFISAKEGILTSARPHLLFHLIAIEIIAVFLQEDQTHSTKEYARVNKRLLIYQLPNFQGYLDSLLETIG